MMHALRFSTMTSAIFLSCSVMPASASITSTVMSLRTMDSSERCTLKNSTESSTRRVFRMPAVSIKMYFCAHAVGFHLKRHVNGVARGAGNRARR